MAPKGTPDSRSDAALVQACNDGDAAQATAAFEALYYRHKDYVVRVALRFVPDHDAALDVLQETFSYLLRKFPPSGSGLILTAKLTSLLYPIAKNSAIDLLRKSNRFPQREGIQPDDLPGGKNPDSDGDDVSILLASLPAERREALTLRFVDDMSLQEIADALQVPLGTVKSRLHLGIKQLRESPETRKFFDP